MNNEQIVQDSLLAPYLVSLQEAGKKIFLITNSPFETVAAGMAYMVGDNWRDLFQVRHHFSGQR